MSRAGSAARLAGVALAGAALVGGAALAGGAPLLPDRPGHPLSLDLTSHAERAAAAPRTPVTRAAAVAAMVCPGAETIGVQGSTAASPLPAAARLSVAAAPPQLTRATDRGGDLAVSALPASGPLRLDGGAAARGASADLDQPAAALVRGTGALAPGLVAEQTTLVTEGDLRGLTTATCRAPAADTWLVGGGGDEGRRGRLVLANAAATPVEVRVDVLSATGPVPSAAGSTVAVPARGRVVLLLDALAPGVDSPVVHVRATGGAVAATLHDALLDGTTAMGTDDVAPAAAPARTVTVPGLTIRGRALLRLAAPGPAEAVGEVRLLGPDGPVDPPGGAAVRVPAGGTLDVDLTDLPPGTYGAQVTTDVPVVAGAMVERSAGEGGPADLAWLASVAPLRTLTGLAAVRTGGQWSTTLELTAPGAAATVDLTTVADDGTPSTSTLRVPAGSSTLTVLPAARSAWVAAVPGSGPVVAARTSTWLNRVGDDHGRLITASALGDLATTWVEPVVLPAG